MIMLIGFLLPPLIDTINRSFKDSGLRFWISVLFCSVIGVAVNYIESNGVYDGLTLLERTETFSKSILMIIGEAQITYQAFWDKSEIRKTLTLDKQV